MPTALQGNKAGSDWSTREQMVCRVNLRVVLPRVGTTVSTIMPNLLIWVGAGSEQ